MTPEQELELAEAEAEAVDQPDAIDPASPLAKAAAEQTGDVLEIQTPTGPWRGTREGVPVLSADEATGGIEPVMRQRVLQTVASLAQGGSHGLAGPVAGANAVKDRLREYLGKKLTGEPTEPLGDTYRRAAASTKASLDEATQAASPTVRGVPILPVLGDVATSGPMAEGVMGRIGINAGLNAVRSAGEGGSALEGAGVGAALSLPVEALGGVLGRVASGAAASKAAIRAAKEARYADEVAKELKVLGGTLGAETQKGSRMLENTTRGVSGVAPSPNPGINPELYQKAVNQLGEQSSVDLQSKILSRNLQELPGQQATIQRLEQELAQATTNAPSEVARRTADYFNTPAMTELAPKFERMGQRAALGAIGYGAGSLYDEATGSTKGRALGAGMAGAMIAAPGMKQMLNNVVRSPRLQTAALDASQSIAREGMDFANISARNAPAMNVSRAVDSLSEYLGRKADKDEAAQVHFKAGNADPSYQDR